MFPIKLQKYWVNSVALLLKYGNFVNSVPLKYSEIDGQFLVNFKNWFVSMYIFSWWKTNVYLIQHLPLFSLCTGSEELDFTFSNVHNVACYDFGLHIQSLDNLFSADATNLNTWFSGRDDKCNWTIWHWNNWLGAVPQKETVQYVFEQRGQTGCQSEKYV